MNINILTYVSFGITACAFVCYLIYFIYRLIKRKSLSKALMDTADFAEELNNTVNSEKFLKLREKCKDFIYSVEKLYSSYAGKAGVFKLDSVLKDMQVACMQEQVEFDKDYWTTYINEEVKYMKGVK